MEKAMHSVKTGSNKVISGFGKAALGAALLTCLGGTALAQNMVVRSTGPSASSYPAGKKFANNTKITLKKLDRVTVLGKSGTRVLKGPGTFSLGQRSTARTSTSRRLAGFISNRSTSRARTGAVRSAGTVAAVEAPTNPNLWNLDIAQGGKFCVANPDRVVLWRPDYTGSATASIVEPATGTVTNIEWRKGSTLKAWPRVQAPVTNGSSYRVLGSNNPTAVEVNFVVLPSMPSDFDQAATMLIENGCQNQLDLLVDKLDTENNQG